MKTGSTSEKPVVEPRQKRAKQTYRSLLAAAQKILDEDGIEALNSNAIVEHAGLTAPAFYRYFEDKYAILAALGRNLMAAQNAVLETALDEGIGNPDTRIDQTKALLLRTLEVTEAFEGGYALMVSLRAIPTLRVIRLESHDHVARLMADQYFEANRDIRYDDAYGRCRLATELGYACIEMLLESDECERELAVVQTAKAIDAVLFS